MSHAIHVKAKSPYSRFVAIDVQKSGFAIAEGRTAKSVIEKAEKSGKSFSLMYVPPKGKKLVFQHAFPS